MKLRPRLALAVALTAAPLVVGLSWLRSDLELQSIREQLKVFVVARMEGAGRMRCEESPETFGGPQPRRGPAERPGGPGGRGQRPDGRPNGRPGDRFDRRPERRSKGGRGERGDRPWGGRDRRAPRPRREEPVLWAYDSAFVSRNPDAPTFPDPLRAGLSGDADAASTVTGDGERELITVAVRMSWTEGPCAIVTATRPLPPAPPLWQWHWAALSVVAGAVLAVFVAAGSLVRRITGLTAQVRHSAAERYAEPLAVRGNDEISGLARAFNEAGAEIRGHLRELEEREETLRAFLANTTHDVMLPLTVLQGHLSRLRDAGGDADPEVVLSALDEAHYMGSLVHNLSAAAKLEGETQVRNDPVDLNALVERAVARHRPIAEGRGVALDFAVPEEKVVVRGDVTLIEQAVSNVVHNAVRYNDDGGHVAAILGLPADAPTTFSLRVVDDGPGIPEDELRHLSERRYRGSEARTRHPDGHGLGLHIARSVAERQGLELQLRPSEHGGLEVEFRGPLA